MHAAIALLSSIIILIIAFFAKVPTYRVSPAFLIPLIWLVYALRRRLHIHPFHYLLFALAVLLHDLGAFGLYQKSPLGLSFDIYVHFYFAFAATFIFYHALEHSLPLRTWQVALFTLLFIMGMGGIHEVMEYGSYLLLGEKGMLKPTTSYFFDTSRDLTNNLLGCLTAQIVIAIARVFRRPLA
jgi:uncharacterized membrane protein YjdF